MSIIATKQTLVIAHNQTLVIATKQTPVVAHNQTLVIATKQTPVVAHNQTLVAQVVIGLVQVVAEVTELV